MTVKRVFLYLVYFVGAVLLFGFLRFPHQAAAWKISTLSERLFPGFTLEMGQMTPCFPPGLCTGESILHAGDAGFVMLDDLCLYGFPGILFSGKKQVRFEGGLAGGNVHGKLTGISSALDRYDTLDLTLTGLHVKQMFSRIQGTVFDLSFDLNGVCRILREENRVKGSGEITLSRVTGAAQSDILAAHDLASMAFDQVDIEWHLEDERITVSKMVAAGRMMTLRLQGEVMLEGGLSAGPDNWQVDLSGSLNPQAAFVSKLAGILSLENLFKTGPEKGIPIQISGPASALEMAL